MSKRKIVSLDSAEFELWQSHDGASSQRIPKRVIMRVIDEELSERQREYLSDYYFDGMSIYEIAAKRGVSASTVSRTIKRARERIKGSLKYMVRM